MECGLNCVYLLSTIKGDCVPSLTQVTKCVWTDSIIEPLTATQHLQKIIKMPQPRAVLSTLSLSLLVFLSVKCEAQETTVSSACSTSFHLLEADLLSRPENRFQLTTKFFPLRDANPVMVKVDYKYEGSNTTNVWFWSESEFYFLQPLEIFLYTSLFFANQPYRMGSITLELSADCLDAEMLHIKALTQRVSAGVYFTIILWLRCLKTTLL